MAKRFYLYSRKRKDKPSSWYAHFRNDDGSMGSPVCTQRTDRSKAEEWAFEALLRGETLAVRKPATHTFRTWASSWWTYGVLTGDGTQIDKSKPIVNPNQAR